jgi:hypothetical protein
MGTYALQRYDERRLDEALAALKTARKTGEPGPLYPWLETWRASGCASGDADAEDFRALFTACSVGKPVDLLDRTPATLAGGQADKDLRSALLGLELGGGLERWMREGSDDGEAHETILGLLRAEDVKRLNGRVQEIAPFALAVDEDEVETYGAAWDRFRRGFQVAADRGEGIVLLTKE